MTEIHAYLVSIPKPADPKSIPLLKPVAMTRDADNGPAQCRAVSFAWSARPVAELDRSILRHGEACTAPIRQHAMSADIDETVMRFMPRSVNVATLHSAAEMPASTSPGRCREADIDAIEYRHGARRHGGRACMGRICSDPQLIALQQDISAELDPPGPNPYGEPFLKDHPELNVISNVVENGKPLGNLGDGEAVWHADMTYVDVPPKAAMLHALEVPPPEAGGNTYFANMFDGLRDRCPPT